MRIVECEQGSDEWFRARMGMPTASEFATVMARGRDGGPSKTRRTYMLKLIGERMTGEPMETYSNRHMERGQEQEQEARDMYAFMRDVEPQQVGFFTDGEKGCSPDGLVGSDGMLEIKSKLAHLHLEVLLSDTVPREHIAQVQGGLWVTEREWCDFMSYCPRLPPFIKRVYRDEEYIKRLSEEVERFRDEMEKLEKAIRQM